MNTKIPVHNNTAMPIYVAGTMIPSGETRHFDLDQLPPEHRPKPVEASPAVAQPANPVAELSRGTVAVIVAAIPGLSDADLELLGDLEQDKGDKARKGVLSAIAEETLKRADGKLTAGQGAGTTTPEAGTGAQGEGTAPQGDGTEAGGGGDGLNAGGQ